MFKRNQFIKPAENDTLFILETYELESATVMGAILKRDTEIFFHYQETGKGAQLFQSSHRTFPRVALTLIQKWDTTLLRSKAKTMPSLNATVYATRLSVKDGKAKIDTFDFENFFDETEAN